MIHFMLKYSCFPATALEAHFLPFLKNPFHQVTLPFHLISAFYMDSLCSGHRATETVHTTATLSQSYLKFGIQTSMKYTWFLFTTCALSTGVITGLKSTLRGTSFICLSSWASAVHMSSCLAVTYERLNPGPINQLRSPHHKFLVWLVPPKSA